MASFSCVVSFKKSPSSKLPRIVWERYSVIHDNYESFVEYVTKNVKEAYPKACDLQFTKPEYREYDNSAIECSPNFWGTSGY